MLYDAVYEVQDFGSGSCLVGVHGFLLMSSSTLSFGVQMGVGLEDGLVRGCCFVFSIQGV